MSKLIKAIKKIANKEKCDRCEHGCICKDECTCFDECNCECTKKKFNKFYQAAVNLLKKADVYEPYEKKKHVETKPMEKSVIVLKEKPKHIEFPKMETKKKLEEIEDMIEELKEEEND